MCAMKKIAFTLVAVLAATPALADTLILTREGLAAIANDLGGSYALGADIDLGGADWTPIGTASEPFTGSLHGNGYAIRNLSCTNSLSGSDYRGLFGCGNGRGQAVRRRSRWMHHGRNGHQQLQCVGRGRVDQLLRRRPGRGVCRR